MSDTFYSYQLSNGHGLPHDPFKAIIAPRPIGWIASENQSGIANLAPYSFFNAFNGAPPIIGFASVGFKDSVSNIKATGEFCWSLATRELADAMNASSAVICQYAFLSRRFPLHLFQLMVNSHHYFVLPDTQYIL